MKVVSAEEMRRIDRETIGTFGIPGSVLMERAGLAVARRVKELFTRRKVIVVAGGGNNGGDGIVAARELFNHGWNVRVLLLATENKLSADSIAQYRIAKKMGLPMVFRTTVSAPDLHSAVVVDAIFGTGLNAAVKEPIRSAIEFINKAEVPVVSVDIPSGISSDNGAVLGAAIRADYTVTFGLPKRGHLLHPGAACSGRIFIEDIGFPRKLLVSEDLMVEAVERGDAAGLIPERPSYSHKGDYGRVLVVAGSRGKTGAALLAARACLRAGAGLVTLGVPESLADVFQTRVTEEMVLPLPDNGEGVLAERAYGDVMDFLDTKADVLAMGPGLGIGGETEHLVRQVLLTATAPMVLDADAVNALSGKTDLLSKVKAPVVLTPHPGEMARLAGRDRAELEKDRIGSAAVFSKETGACLVLKGVPTVTASEGRVFINATGNPGMATAGAGDVLTGIIAGLLGQGLNPLNASILGVHLHGSAGDLAAEEKGMHSLTSGDIVESLPRSFSLLKDG